MVIVVDCGISNTGSVLNMLRRLGVAAEATSDPERVAAAERLLLPGVGAFDAGMEQLEARGLVAPLEAARAAGTPVLGLCLGMQLMTRGSDEGVRPGLGWFDATTRRLEPDDPALKVPHMGWNRVEACKSSKLFALDGPPQRFYFVHSYYVDADDDRDVLARTWHGHSFCSAVERDNLAGVQFHPEKSHRFGLELLRRFCEDF